VGGALVAHATHSLVTVFGDHPLGLFSFWVWAAMLLVDLDAPALLEATRRRVMIGVSFVVAPLILLGLAFVPFAWSPWLAAWDVHAAKLQMAQAAQEHSPTRTRQLQRDAALRLEQAIQGAAQRGETMATLGWRELWAQVTAASGETQAALAILLDLERRCPRYSVIELRIASVAAMAGQWSLADRYFTAAITRFPLDPIGYDAWWRLREHLDRHQRREWILEQLDAALEILASAGLTDPARDSRHLELETLRRRILLEPPR
jgi:hypothetical protein